MKNLIASTLVFFAFGANAQLIQQQGNRVYITEQSGAMTTFESNGNQIRVLPAQTFTPTPLNTQIVPMGQPNRPATPAPYTGISGGNLPTGMAIAGIDFNRERSIGEKIGDGAIESLSCASHLLISPFIVLISGGISDIQKACTIK